MTLLNIVHEFC